MNRAVHRHDTDVLSPLGCAQSSDLTHGDRRFLGLSLQLILRVCDHVGHILEPDICFEFGGLPRICYVPIVKVLVMHFTPRGRSSVS